MFVFLPLVRNRPLKNKNAAERFDPAKKLNEISQPRAVSRKSSYGSQQISLLPYSVKRRDDSGPLNCGLQRILESPTFKRYHQTVVLSIIACFSVYI
jgi:hypothetical protein